MNDEQRANDLMQELVERGWTASDVAGAFSVALGALCRASSDTHGNLLSAVTAIESAAGVKTDHSLASQMPCPDCWQEAIASIEEQAATGEQVGICPHRNLALVLRAMDGVIMQWTVRPVNEKDLKRHRQKVTH